MSGEKLASVTTSGNNSYSDLRSESVFSTSTPKKTPKSKCRSCCSAFVFLFVLTFIGVLYVGWKVYERDGLVEEQAVNSTTCGRRPFLSDHPMALMNTYVAESIFPIPGYTQKALAQPGEFPWLGYVLTVKDLHNGYLRLGKCTTTLVNHHKAISAGHCFEGDYDYIIVGFGPIDYDSVFRARLNPFGMVFPHLRNVVDFQIHSKMKHPKNSHFQYDLAVLTFDYPIVFTPYIQPACFSKYPKYMLGFPKAEDVFSAGYGRFENKPDLDNLELRFGRTFLWSMAQCRDFFGKESYACANIAATGGKNSTHIHEGDNGGPLLVHKDFKQWFQIGVASYYLRNTATDKHAVDVFSLIDCHFLVRETGQECYEF